MCTAINLLSKSNEYFFGRTMDFSHDIEPKFFVIPKGYNWINTINGKLLKDDYKFIGIGQEKESLLGFFDGVNEEGFAAAALYFAGYAKYDELSTNKDKESVASIDFLHYMLGRCKSIDDLVLLLKNTNIVGLKDPVTNTVAPLHWIAMDKEGKCVVIEPTDKGVKVINNPIGVMANSPDFNWHMTNLRNYTGVSPKQNEETNWGSVELNPFGQGAGTANLPGGFTSPERFVRATYLKMHIPTPEDSMDAINSCFHIMESVSIPKGAVLTNRGADDYTKYIAFININTCEYFYKTYDNLQVKVESLFK